MYICIYVYMYICIYIYAYIYIHIYVYINNNSYMIMRINELLYHNIRISLCFMFYYRVSMIHLSNQVSKKHKKSNYGVILGLVLQGQRTGSAAKTKHRAHRFESIRMSDILLMYIGPTSGICCDDQTMSSKCCLYVYIYIHMYTRTCVCVCMYIESTGWIYCGDKSDELKALLIYTCTHMYTRTLNIHERVCVYSYILGQRSGFAAATKR